MQGVTHKPNVTNIITKFYKPINLNDIERTYLQLKPKLLKAVVDYKIDFLEFLGGIILDKSLRAYTSDLNSIKELVERFDNLNTTILDEMLTNNKIKQYLLIKFLKCIKHQTINLYKTQIVEPLIRSSTRLVFKLAKEVNIRLPFEDLIMLGLEGLVDAAWRYEPCKGFKFTTYARHWIRQRMFTGIETILKVPSAKMMRVHKLYPLYKQYRNEMNSGDIDGFVKWLKMKSIDVDPKLIKLVLSASQTISYEALAEKYENRTSDDIIDNQYGLCDSNFERFVEDVEDREYVEKFKGLIKNTLSQLEYDVFMMIVFGGCRKDEVCKKIGVSRYEVERVYKRAITKLKALFPTKDALIHLIPSQPQPTLIDNIL